MTRHRHLAYPTSGRLFRGGELIRLMTMLLMLFVLFTTITRLRSNPDMLSWLVAEQGEDTQIMRHAAPAKPAEATPQPAPQPAEKPAADAASPSASATDSAPQSATAQSEPPLDQESEEKEALREEFQAVTDGRVSREVIEMGAYLRLIRWARTRNWAQLLQVAEKGFVYTDFVQSPDRFRGKVMTMKLDARRILACPPITDPDDPTKKLVLYEVWGFTKESRSFPYVFAVLDLPEGMPYGPDAQETVRVAGYFFGLQGYYSSYSKPGSAPLKAPLFIGRLEWIKPQPVQLTQTDWKLVWGAGGVAVLIVVGTMGYLAFRSRGGPPRLAGDRAESGKLTMDQWLDQAETGQAAVDLGEHEFDDFDAALPHCEAPAERATSVVQTSVAPQPSQN